MTSVVARPRFLVLLTGSFVVWIAINLVLHSTGHRVFDSPPFQWLQDAGTLIALYITVLILITQRRENILTDKREQLTLELAILSEQKAAKIIELLQELRRDHPQLEILDDQEADDMSRPADPQAVLDAIHDTHEEESSASLGATN